MPRKVNYLKCFHNARSTLKSFMDVDLLEEEQPNRKARSKLCSNG